MRGEAQKTTGTFPDPNPAPRAPRRATNRSPQPPLPAGRVQFAPELTQPTLKEAMAGVEQQLPGALRLNAMYIRRRGSNLLRGVNVNAPRADLTRPDPRSGTVTEIRSTASSAVDLI